MFDETDQLSVDAIRALSIDCIEHAKSGHPGMPLGAAPMAYVLTKQMTFNPTDSHWFNRDRFVLSAGHGSALLYSMLHLAGFQVSLDDLKNYRSLNSNTPGHPEFGVTEGVDASTGPLGQGLGMAVGMAMAEQHLAARYNRPNFPIIDHHTFVIAGDGDLMEGISHEAGALAGHLKLNRLIVLYDSNDNSLDGPTKNTFTECIKERFEAYGWNYDFVPDGNDLDEINLAIERAKAQKEKPTLIEIKSIIGYGAPNAGTHRVHGNILGPKGALTAKKKYGWHYPEFFIPQHVYARFSQFGITGKKAEEKWKRLFSDYQNQYPQLAEELETAIKGDLPKGWSVDLPVYDEGEAEAGRTTVHKLIQHFAQKVPYFWGGSADLFASNKTNIADQTLFAPETPEGRNIWFGVREFGEAAAVNGIALHGGSKIYASTFFVFSDYMRNAIRLAALQKIPVTYLFTHDSIALGPDGPTHQPIEHLASFRAMPGVVTLRPGDPVEAVESWKLAMRSTDHPTILALTRQDLPVLSGTKQRAHRGVARGAYVLSPQTGTKPEGILIASGSELGLALRAQERLAKSGTPVSVVSMPSMELFEQQSEDYKESILPRDVTLRISIEMGSTFGWDRYVGFDGACIGIDGFGASGNAAEFMRLKGFTVENVVRTYHALKEKRSSICHLKK
ncbi:transketolase [Sporolactobacillus terrae]|uniref:Transketolase n=1 Tax=Sporolactobacillus terrae TaxID=269673 RepID=A0A5K7WTF0_9BACL|nr:transketolase [Sporolactobacillus terrae]BBN97961.1 transketolase [Sporolactobacillus terrae]